MKVTKNTFGLLSNGKKVHLYTLKAGDIALSISTLGAAWTSLFLPSRSKKVDDILLGYHSLDGYINDINYFGATLGRFAGRIGSAGFSLGGEDFSLCKNDGKNSLHGGRLGFSKRIWKADAYEERDGVFVRFELESPDGEEGYPGNLSATVSYGLTKSNEIVADYTALVDTQCPVNLSNHAYFNLAGEAQGNILSTEVKLHSSSYLELDNALIPTGMILPIEKTPFDFKVRKALGKDIKELDSTSGYDHCFVISGEAGKLRPCAETYDPNSGRLMRVFTTQPGLHLYTGNKLASVHGKIGSIYNKHDGFCLETQHLSDSPNRSDFPNAIFGPGRDYHEKAVFAFDW